MKIRDISNLLLTLIGLSIIVKAVFIGGSLSALFLSFSSNESVLTGVSPPMSGQAYSTLILVTQILIPLAFGLALIFGSKKITSWILHWVSDDDRTIGTIDAHQVSHLAFVLLGVYLLARTVPETAGFIFEFFKNVRTMAAFSPPDMRPMIYSQALGDGVSHALAVGIAILILCKSKSLANLVAGRLRDRF